MRIHLILLAIGLLLAGCVTPSNESGVAPAADDAPAPDDTKDAEPAPSDAPAASAPEADAHGAIPPAEEPFEFTGRTPIGACAWAFPAAGYCTQYGAESTWVELAPEGTPQSVHAEMTWSAESPATESLSIMLLVQGEDGWWSLMNDETYAYGASPLSVEWDVASTDGSPLALAVSASNGAGVGLGVAGAGASASFAQEFTVTGVLATLPPDA